jgi:hypothetical protein
VEIVLLAAGLAALVAAGGCQAGPDMANNAMSADENATEMAAPDDNSANASDSDDGAAADGSEPGGSSAPDADAPPKRKREPQQR